MHTSSVNFAGLAIADGGKIEKLLEKELARAALDCEDRPGNGAPRVVTIKLNTTPQLDSNGDLTVITTNTEVEVSPAKLPPYRSRPINSQIKKGGKMVFSELSQNNSGQRTLNPDAFPPVETGSDDE